MPVVLLNGCSSSGKSSIASSLQQHANEPYLAIGLDKFIDLLPAKFVGDSELSPQGFHFKQGTEGHHRIVQIETGPLGQRILNTRLSTYLMLAEQWKNLVIDEVLLDDKARRECLLELAPFSVYFIGVVCDLAVMERRESERGDRMTGMARWQLDLVHGPTRHYDLIVDTTNESAEQCANRILRFIEGNAPRSLECLRQEFCL